MRPKTTVNWRDTNLEYIGSDLDHKIKEAAANREPQWDGIEKGVGLRVWRIENFCVVEWPKSKYGKFHVGDSYVVLNTTECIDDRKRDGVEREVTDSSLHQDVSSSYNENTNLSYNIHIWIGNESTQDEYGTAAYKMVEADDRLGGVAVEHREVQNNESNLFLSYFDHQVTYLEGGIESGFNHVEPTIAEPHLYKVKGTRSGIAMTQVPVRKDEMNCGDVFILHAGDTVWNWIGNKSNPVERIKGMEVARSFSSKRNVIVLNQGIHDGEEEAADFWSCMLQSSSSSNSATRGGKMLNLFKNTRGTIGDADNDDMNITSFVPELLQMPDSGVGRLKRVAKARAVDSAGVGKAPWRRGASELKFNRSVLNEERGYILDTGFHIYIWLGKKVSKALRVSALPLSNQYFKRWRRPTLPITICKDGHECPPSFQKFFFNSPAPTSTTACPSQEREGVGGWKKFAGGLQQWRVLPFEENQRMV